MTKITESSVKSVLITGATSGIGQQLVIDYSLAGWRVIACGRRKAALVELQGSLPNIDICIFDVMDREQTQQVLSAITIPQLCIFSTGDCEYFNQGEIDVSLTHRLFDVNFFGVVYGLSVILPRMKSGDHCVVLSSMVTYVPFSRAEAYGASKAALTYFCNSLAVDLHKKGVLLSVVEPGFVRTRLTDKNDFTMPTCVDVIQASQWIRAGIDAKQAAIVFPWRLRGILQVIRWLPIGAQRWVMSRLIKKESL